MILTAAEMARLRSAGRWESGAVHTFHTAGRAELRPGNLRGCAAAIAQAQKTYHLRVAQHVHCLAAPVAPLSTDLQWPCSRERREISVAGVDA